jgi:hypothetical protein
MLTELGKLARKARREGRVEGQQEALLRVLRRRFAPVPEEIETRVRRITDVQVLGRLVEEAATMPALPEDWPADTRGNHRRNLQGSAGVVERCR